MVSAYVLAGELANAGGRHEEAFGKYEALLRAYITTKATGRRTLCCRLCAKDTDGALWFRNQVIKAFAIPGLARLTVGRDIIDALRLPDYHW